MSEYFVRLMMDLNSISSYFGVLCFDLKKMLSYNDFSLWLFFMIGLKFDILSF